MVREVVQKEKEVSAAVKKLQADLASEKQLHLQEVDERNAIIAKLKEDLVAVRTKSSIETKYLHKVARARGLSLRPCSPGMSRAAASREQNPAG